MSTVLNPVSLARQPLQQRAKDRFESVLDEADTLLLEAGLDGFSIPELAKRLDYPRASIYKFFPTPSAVLNELVKRYLAQMEGVLLEAAPQLVNMSWTKGARRVVELLAEFHNKHPVSRLLTLSSHFSADSYRAQEHTIQRLGKLLRQLIQQRGIELPSGSPDVATLTVEIGATCFRLSFFLHGKITPAYRDEAVHAMVAYLSRYMPVAQAARRKP